MKKILYSFLLLLVLIPTVAFAKDYDSIEFGTVLNSADTFKSISGVPENYYYTSSSSVDGSKTIPIALYDYYEIRFFLGHFDSDGNFVYDDEPYVTKYYNTQYTSSNTISIPYGTYNDDKIKFVAKEISGEVYNTNGNTWYYYKDSANHTDNISFYKDLATIDFYEVYDDEASTTIVCDKTNVTFGNTISCSINFKSNYVPYSASFKLSSSKFKISNVKPINFLWNSKDNGDNSYDISFDITDKTYYMDYLEHQDEYDSYEDYFKEKYNVDISDEDVYNDLIYYTNGKNVITFDVTYDNGDDLNNIEDVLKVSDFSYTNTFGTINVATINQDISFSKEEETVVENPKTGITTLSYLLIPILVGSIILIKNKKKMTLFKNK